MIGAIIAVIEDTRSMVSPSTPLLLVKKILKKFTSLFIAKEALDLEAANTGHPYFILGSIMPYSISMNVLITMTTAQYTVIIP